MHARSRSVKLVLAALVGCVAGSAGAAPDTASILADKDRFLVEAFAPAKLPAAVRDVFTDHPAVKFQRLRATLEIVSDENGQTVTRTGELTLRNAGNGLVQRAIEWQRNGIPVRLNGALTYRNVISLWVQDVIYSKPKPERASGTRAVSAARGMEAPEAGKEYAFEYTVGFDDVELALAHVCKAGPTVAASTLHAKLTGDAVQLDCDMLGPNRNVLNRLRYFVLTDLGTAMLVQDSSETMKITFKLQDVTVER